MENKGTVVAGIYLRVYANGITPFRSEFIWFVLVIRLSWLSVCHLLALDLGFCGFMYVLEMVTLASIRSLSFFRISSTLTFARTHIRTRSHTYT